MIIDSDFWNILCKVENITEPDRVVDAKVWKLINDFPELHVGVHSGTNNSFVFPSVPHLTSSVDAVSELIDDKFAWNLGKNVHHNYWSATIYILENEEPICVSCSNSTKLKATALLSAVLRKMKKEIENE